ncbi:MAG: DUF1285 domain-containing protein [Pseudomonadota bacterium]
MAASTLQGVVDTIVASTAGLPDPATIASWDPALSGDIEILISADGTWSHAGTVIQREGLVRLFASLLRRESDGHYYLVTPVEKWRIKVEGHPLRAIDCDRQGHNGHGYWFVLLNTGGRCRVGGRYQLHVDECKGDSSYAAGVTPWVELPNGLSAQLTRAAWYRLIDAATFLDDRVFIVSGGERIELGSLAG